MYITIKESMIIRKCLNNYVLEHNLEYDKSPLFNNLIHKLKEWESGDSNRAQSLNEGIHKKLNLKLRAFNRGLLNKDLKKYNFQSITNRKILELMESERVELINDNEIIK